MPVYVLTDPQGLILRLYIQPGVSKSGWAGIHDDRLKLKVKAPPVDGAANEAVLSFVASVLGLKKSEVELFRGEKSRMKDIRLLIDQAKISGVLDVLQEHSQL